MRSPGMNQRYWLKIEHVFTRKYDSLDMIILTVIFCLRNNGIFLITHCLLGQSQAFC